MRFLSRRNCPKIDAENLKVSMGHVRFDPHCDKNDSYDLPSYAGFAHEHNRVLTRQALSGIIDMKLRDILEAIYNRLRDKNLRHLISYGVVLTGGGAQLKGYRKAGKRSVQRIYGWRIYQCSNRLSDY